MTPKLTDMTKGATYQNRDTLKRLGAHWDGDLKHWIVDHVSADLIEFCSSHGIAIEGIPAGQPTPLQNHVQAAAHASQSQGSQEDPMFRLVRMLEFVLKKLNVLPADWN